MKFIVNNKVIEENQEMSIMDLINMLGYHKWCLVVVNENTLLQEEYINRKICDGDNIRIVKPLFGG